MHRQLKAWIAGNEAPQEVRLGRYRADAVVEGRVIEVQVSSLAALSRKLADLLTEHPVCVVKPIVARKRIVLRKGARESRRWSPKRGAWTDLFDELVFLTRVLPHPRFELHALLVEVEEFRRPKPVHRCRWKRPDYDVDDVELTGVLEEKRVRSPFDLWGLLPAIPEGPFDTADLAQLCGIPRWRAQRAAYTLSHAGAARALGRRGRSQLYERLEPKSKRSRTRRKRAA